VTRSAFKWPTQARTPVLFGAVLLAFSMVVLWPGFRLAGEIDDTSASLRLVSEQRRQVDVMAGALAAVRDRLESFGYVDDPIREIRTGSGELDGLVRTLSGNPTTTVGFDASPYRAIQRSDVLRADVAALDKAWLAYRAVLAPVALFDGVPFVDSESAGVQLSDAGRALGVTARKSQADARTRAPQVTAALARLAGDLEVESARLAGYLRLLMLLALAAAVILGAGAAYLALARRREAAMLADAERQTRDILSTVREGLFLIDPEGRIGATHSASMLKIFKRNEIAGLSFEALLLPIVSTKTLQTAQRFVEVLWSERTREKLVKTINPLQEVEVSFDDGSGVPEIRWLEFDFHRVRSGGKLAHLLVSVSDVTQRVRLARELGEARENTQSQVDALLGVLQIDPHKLDSFLGDSNAGMRMMNALLREPAHDEVGLRRKLDGIFRQVHSIKGEAAALGLGTVQTRAHEFETDLRGLRERTTLSGGDFLPMTVRLDDLFTHLEGLRELVARVRGSAAGATVGPAGGADGGLEGAEPATALADTLRSLAERLATERGTSVRLVTEGLSEVPAIYRRAVKDISVQVVRNALAHGIETPERRSLAGKNPTGVVRIEFRRDDVGSYRLVMEDDGGGVSLRKVGAAAVDRGVLTSEEVAGLDTRQMLSLLLRPGFSTIADPDAAAGHGVGMNVVAELVREFGGKVGIATGEGRFTRFTIALPAAPAGRSAQVA
jgi:two-component system, chemotaxis family, sensor kinase CheA